MIDPASPQAHEITSGFASYSTSPFLLGFLFRLDGFEPKADEDNDYVFLLSRRLLLIRICRASCFLVGLFAYLRSVLFCWRRFVTDDSIQFDRYNVHQWRSGGLVDSISGLFRFSDGFFFLCKPLATYASHVMA